VRKSRLCPICHGYAPNASPQQMLAHLEKCQEERAKKRHEEQVAQLAAEMEQVFDEMVKDGQATVTLKDGKKCYTLLDS
jgi:hypothetical protein